MSGVSKPILDIAIRTVEEIQAPVKAVFDSGSQFSILRKDKVPPGAAVLWRKNPRTFRTAASGARLLATGELPVVLIIGDREIDDVVLVSEELTQEMVVGAGLMQKWDVSIVTRDGITRVIVGRDMRDPDLTIV